MSIFDIFQPKPVAPAATTTPAPNANQQPATPPTGNPSGDLSKSPPAVGPDGKMPGSSVTPANPLDSYTKLFDNAGKSAPAEPPKFQLDPKVVGEVASKMDLMQGVDPALVQKATTGDVQALMQVIQNVGQNSYRAAIEHNSALTDAFLNQRSTFEKNEVSQNVRQQLTQSQLANQPNYDHPVIRNELNRIASQFAAANPDMPPQQIAEAAKKYVADLAGALAPSAPKKSDTPSATPGDENFDWASYITGSPSSKQ